MNHEYRRRGKNWFTTMGVLFIVMALVVLIRNLLIWGPEFVLDFFLSAEVTNEKISAGMLVFGVLMIFLGFRKTN
ncbi:MAG: hypothetical protein ACT4NJ_02230 [Nitrosopumilaceae archaeon]